MIFSIASILSVLMNVRKMNWKLTALCDKWNGWMRTATLNSNTFKLINWYFGDIIYCDVKHTWHAFNLIPADFLSSSVVCWRILRVLLWMFLNAHAHPLEYTYCTAHEISFLNRHLHLIYRRGDERERERDFYIRKSIFNDFLVLAIQAIQWKKRFVWKNRPHRILLFSFFFFLFVHFSCSTSVEYSTPNTNNNLESSFRRSIKSAM